MMRRILIALTALMMLGGVAGVARAQSDSAAVSSASHKDTPGNGGNCGDTIDNDNDGYTDAADPGCDQPGCQPSGVQPKKCQEDTDNQPVDDCADGLDNDHDGYTDAADPDCQEGGSGDEVNDDSTPDDCADGLDNEGDGYTDAADPDCQEGGSGDEVNDDSTTPDDCADGLDNDGDGLIDAADPDCQDGGSGNEDTDNTPPPAVNKCTAGTHDPGILTPDTLGQTLFDAGLNFSPLFEDPEADGPLSGAIYDGGNGTPLEPVTDEVSCVVDLLFDGAALGADL
jgi:hypothetical protein